MLQINELLTRFDRNSDGRLDYNEFLMFYPEAKATYVVRMCRRLYGSYKCCCLSSARLLPKKKILQSTEAISYTPLAAIILHRQLGIF